MFIKHFKNEIDRLRNKILSLTQMLQRRKYKRKKILLRRFGSTDNKERQGRPSLSADFISTTIVAVLSFIYRNLCHLSPFLFCPLFFVRPFRVIRLLVRN